MLISLFITIINLNRNILKKAKILNEMMVPDFLIRMDIAWLGACGPRLRCNLPEILRFDVMGAR